MLMWQKLCKFVVTKKQITNTSIPMSKGKSFISEIGKYFKENDATSAMNQIMDITRMLNLSEKRLFGEESRCNCKYSQLQVLQLLLLFPCFMIKNAFNYSASSLCGIADCGKDVFYRFLSRGTMTGVRSSPISQPSFGARHRQAQRGMLILPCV